MNSLEFPSCCVQVMKVRRLNRKCVNEGATISVPSQSFVVTFCGQMLPERVFLYCFVMNVILPGKIDFIYTVRAKFLLQTRTVLSLQVNSLSIYIIHRVMYIIHRGFFLFSSCP